MPTHNYSEKYVITFHDGYVLISDRDKERKFTNCVEYKKFLSTLYFLGVGFLLHDFKS